MMLQLNYYFLREPVKKKKNKIEKVQSTNYESLKKKKHTQKKLNKQHSQKTLNKQHTQTTLTNLNLFCKVFFCFF